MAFLDSLLSRNNNGLKPIVQRAPAPPKPPTPALATPTRIEPRPAPPPPPPAPMAAPPPPRIEVRPPVKRPPPPPPAAPPPVSRAAEAIAPLRRAVVLQARGDHEAAVAEFTRALELDPAAVEAWSGRGISREHLGDLAGARLDYTRSLQIEVGAEIERQRLAAV